MSANCRPAYGDHYDPSYKYHAWTCRWQDADGCDGVLRVVGHTPRGSFGWSVLRGKRCE